MNTIKKSIGIICLSAMSMSLNAANLNANKSSASNSNTEYADGKFTNLHELQRLTDETVTNSQYEIDDSNLYINAKTDLIAQVVPAEYLNVKNGNTRNNWTINENVDYAIERNSNHSLVQETLSPVPFFPAVILFGLSLVSLFFWKKFR